MAQRDRGDPVRFGRRTGQSQPEFEAFQRQLDLERGSVCSYCAEVFSEAESRVEACRPGDVGNEQDDLRIEDLHGGPLSGVCR